MKNSLITRTFTAFFTCILIILTACSASEVTTPVVVEGEVSMITTPTIVTQSTDPLPSPSPDIVTVTETPVVTTPPTLPPTRRPTMTPQVSPTVDLLFPFTLAGLQAGDYSSGAIDVRWVMEETPDFTRSYISYPSDGLTITGMMLDPIGPGPHPVVILLHGYIERSEYYTGADTSQAAAYYASNGYLTLAPDFRSWGESDSGLSLFHTGLVRDVLNLIGAVPSLAEADPQQVVLWGHSMGGGMATKVLVVDDRPVAAVLYAPNSADDADLIARWGRGCLPGESQVNGDQCNPAEVIPSDTPPDLVNVYLESTTDREKLQATSPYFHLDQIQVPVQIHIGTSDGQALEETPTDWSAKLYAGLLDAGKSVEYHTYQGEGHAFLGVAWQQFLERSLLFFDTILGR